MCIVGVYCVLIQPLILDQEFHVLGQQKLTELRDKIVCMADHIAFGEFSENPNQQPDILTKVTVMTIQHMLSEPYLSGNHLSCPAMWPYQFGSLHILVKAVKSDLFPSSDVWWIRQKIFWTVYCCIVYPMYTQMSSSYRYTGPACLCNLFI